MAAGSVMERGKVGGDVMGGVPWFDEERCRLWAGSVVRRAPGGWKGVTAGVDVGGEWAGVLTTATELVGLSLAGKPKPAPRGEAGLADVDVCRLFRNCCLASVPDGWPWSD